MTTISDTAAALEQGVTSTSQLMRTAFAKAREVNMYSSRFDASPATCPSR